MLRARLAASLVAVALVAGCAGPVTTKASSVTPSEPVASANMPTQLAPCDEMPAAGWYDYQDQSLPGHPIKRVQIGHTLVACNEPFTEVVDFTYLGNWPGCSSNPKAAKNLRRPCDEGFKQHPDKRAIALNGAKGDWRPVEGTDLLKVECQFVADTTLNQGVLQDIRYKQSNVWNKIRDPRISGGVGWINDLWMGNAGFRGLACPPSDAYVG